MRSRDAFLPLLGLALVVLGASAPAPAVFQPSAGRSACNGVDGYARAPGGRRTFLWRHDVLAAVKADPTAPAHAPRFRRLIAAADEALGRKPRSVVDKTIAPSSGDKHDYASAAAYWWPDETTKDGTPYVRRDGHSNPAVLGEGYDFSRLDGFAADVGALSLAYYVTDDPRYAAHAARMIRTWFLDPATRMNPNLRFAGAVKGRDTGRANGIIDTYRFIVVIEAVGLIEPSGELSAAEVQALRRWFGEYLRWMTTDRLGRDEAARNNNHGTFYDSQVVSYALFSGDLAQARTTARQAGPRRIGRQIAADGTLPEEVARAKSLNYSLIGTQALIDLATLSECAGVDLWRYRGADGAGLHDATDFIARYAGREEDWPYPGAEVERSKFFAALAAAGWAYDEPAYWAKAEAYAGDLATKPLTLATPLASGRSVAPRAGAAP